MITAYNPQTKLRQTYNTHQVKPFYRDINNNMKELKSENDHGQPPYTVHITEVIEPNDPRAWKFDEPIKKEIEGLIKRKTWKIVCRSEVPDDANILGGRFVLAIKDEGTNREIWKARFIVQGHLDGLKNWLVHNISVIRQHAIKMLVGIAAIFGFQLFSTDVTQAYLQSAEKLQRYIFIDRQK